MHTNGRKENHHHLVRLCTQTVFIKGYIFPPPPPTFLYYSFCSLLVQVGGLGHNLSWYTLKSSKWTERVPESYRNKLALAVTMLTYQMNGAIYNKTFNCSTSCELELFSSASHLQLCKEFAATLVELSKLQVTEAQQSQDKK